ncbi:MAG: helix-turn-helix domain-containing protein [Agriterribacter sp.]
MKALNKANTVKEAAELLGVPERTLYEMREQYKVNYSRHDDEYFYASEKNKSHSPKK